VTTEATITNNRVSGYGTGFQFNNTSGGKLGTHSGNTIHSCTAGFVLANAFDGTITNLTTCDIYPGDPDGEGKRKLYISP
jgi:hypothetical protein